MFIATGEKARMSRLATIFAVVAWYFLKRSVANCASTAAGLSQTSNSRTWFGSFCEIAILNWRQPSSFAAALGVGYLRRRHGHRQYAASSPNDDVLNRLERIKEIDQILLLIRCETDGEALVIEVHYIHQSGC